MTDVHSKAIRSKNMSAIRGTDTKPELIVRRALHALGFRYRLHYRNLPGKPDIVLPKYRVAIFVNGCFWHKHECSVFKLPSTRREWWNKKLTANRLRDETVQDKLRESGWRVVIVWECCLKGKDKLDTKEVLDRFTSWLSSNISYLEIPSPELT